MVKTLIISIILNLVLAGLLSWIYFSPVKQNPEEVQLKEQIKIKEAQIEKVYSDGCNCTFHDGKIIFH